MWSVCGESDLSGVVCAVMEEYSVVQQSQMSHMVMVLNSLSFSYLSACLYLCLHYYLCLYLHLIQILRVQGDQKFCCGGWRVGLLRCLCCSTGQSQSSAGARAVYSLSLCSSEA